MGMGSEPASADDPVVVEDREQAMPIVGPLDVSTEVEAVPAVEPFVVRSCTIAGTTNLDD
jgi:hypothetical protein